MLSWEQICNSVVWIFSGIGVALIGVIGKWIWKLLWRKQFIGEVGITNYKGKNITLKQYKQTDYNFTEDEVVRESKSISRYNIEPVDPYKAPLSLIMRQSDQFRNQEVYESQTSIYLKSVDKYKRRVAESRDKSAKLCKIDLNVTNRGRLSGEDLDIILEIDTPENLLAADANEKVIYKRLGPPMNIGKLDILCLPPQLEEIPYEIITFDFTKHPDSVVKCKVPNLNISQSELVATFYVLLSAASTTLIHWSVAAKNTKIFSGVLTIKVE
jgi:hypothetical protein